MLQWSMGSEGLLEQDQARVRDKELLSEENSAFSWYIFVILEKSNDDDRQAVSITCMSTHFDDRKSYTKDHNVWYNPFHFTWNAVC